jgi:hypothetical protein
MEQAIITELTHTCLACPSLWEGTLADGRPLYIRYRWGELCIHVGEAEEEVFKQHLPGAGDFDGCIELDEALAYTGLQLAAGVVVAEAWDG